MEASQICFEGPFLLTNLNCMRSFRSEIENPVVERDIIELEQKIAQFKHGKIDEERFRSLRLARGVYGQRQPGVQMIRIKIPFGKLNARKLRRICSVSDEYSRGRLHITTRQDIQIHHVKLDRTPELWAELEKDEVTLREACGNTVRNITASETSGIDLHEPFDPRPYADALFRYFLRNPICQDMGRKFKISFSNTDADTGMAFMHDLGFIAKTRETKGKTVHGFQVWVAGGLGSQSRHALKFRDFITADQIIPLTEAVLRVFERYGERNRRMKARLKFLVKDWGFDKFTAAVETELNAVPASVPIPHHEVDIALPKTFPDLITEVTKQDAFKLWQAQNVFLQKNGLFAIGIKVRLGDFYTDQARRLADLMENYSGNELTLTIHQNIIVRHVPEENLPHWYKVLDNLGLADIGFNRFNDLTACPGTDTCNLGIASSTGLATILEEIIQTEYPNLAKRDDMLVKLSGCMNSCGQHMIATIGFQGMSMRTPEKKVLPATQVLLGGGRLGDGKGRFGDKIIKLPSKRVPEALRIILNDFQENGKGEQSFLEYYLNSGERYFYELLKPLAKIDNLGDDDFIDWGHSAPYIKAIGIGECAGVVIDLISTLFFESEEKIELAKRALETENYRDSIYHSYAAIINTAKALLLTEDHKTNTHAGIIANFDAAFVENGKIELPVSFTQYVLRLKSEQATRDFAVNYFADALTFYKKADQFRKADLEL